MHMYIFMLILFFSFAETGGIGMEVMFWTSIGDPVHCIYRNITLVHAFNIYADTHASWHPVIHKLHNDVEFATAFHRL